MKALFLSEPPETFVPYKDTTRVLMAEATARDIGVYTATHADLELRDGQVGVWARPLVNIRQAEEGENTAPWFVAGGAERIDVDTFHSVWFRHDPPFDTLYLHATRMVELARRPLKINEPAGLRHSGEKLLVQEFPELGPVTLVSRSQEEILSFLADVGGRGVVKPLDGFGGQGIFVVDLSDPNLRAILQTVTNDGSSWTLAQAYIKDAHHGDRRVLLMDGEIVGEFLRVPRRGEFRGNMAQGGTVETALPSDDVQRIVRRVGPRLRELGLRLVGLDVVGGLLTEINVTSPTGFQEVRRLTGARPEVAVWDALVRQTAT